MDTESEKLYFNMANEEKTNNTNIKATEEFSLGSFYIPYSLFF